MILIVIRRFAILVACLVAAVAMTLGTAHADIAYPELRMNRYLALAPMLAGVVAGAGVDALFGRSSWARFLAVPAGIIAAFASHYFIGFAGI